MTFSTPCRRRLHRVFVGAAFAQQAPPVAVRATIEAVADDGASLSVRIRSGETATFRSRPRRRSR